MTRVDPPAPEDRGPLSPHWEAWLRSGQAAEGEEGSIEDELAVVRLLRHAVAPEALSPAAEREVWAAVETAVAPDRAARGWWSRSRGLWFVAAGLVAALVAVAVLRPRVAPPGPSDPAMARVLEGQFERLAPAARARLAADIEGERRTLRGDLLALALGAGAEGP